MSSKHFSPPGPLGFGGAPLGNMFDEVDEATASQTLRAAWDSGIRLFDTAPHYGSGLSEHRFGQVLREYPRDEFTLATKVGRVFHADRSAPKNPPFVNGLPFAFEYDYSYDGVMRSIEDSYQRLGMAQIDIAYIHDVAADHHGDAWSEKFKTAIEGGARALTQLREQGVIKAWGLGVNLVEPCIKALDQADPDVFLLAGRYSLLNQPALDQLFPACQERGVHVVVGGPFNSGLLAGGAHYEYGQAPDEMLDKRQRIAEICQRYQADLRAVALQFCAAHPVVSAVIPGTKHADKVRENAKLMRATIPAELWAELKQQGLLPQSAPTPR
ncbi:aldo/keto reductase [Oleiagrimonas sp. C23AA]|uniref:aldo/keto reductase n=1 Tax=Oleiagrimonas sp. C23AA TaxID=2719047 RepID=UPI00141F44A3|nr:aldo/keto reductase [Oleiagrimonas sp. C23AA]NII09432.1 aldo/keto reductase [Oleiagrimonas sp. C23AA]